MYVFDIGEQKNGGDDGIIHTVFQKGIVQSGDERKSKSIHDITCNVERHHKSTKGKANNEIGQKTDVIEVFGIKKKVGSTITRSDVTGDGPEKYCPKN